MAEDCADDDDDKSAIRDLRKRVVKRLQMHDALIQVINPLFQSFLNFFLTSVCLDVRECIVI